MRKLAAIGCASMLGLSMFAACSGDEVKKVHGDEAGAGGVPAGGTDAVGGFHQGGGNAEPTAGAGGVEVALGGAAGAGAAPGKSAGGAGGTPEPSGGAGASGAQGGGPAVECPAEAGVFTHQCANAVETWVPVWNGTLQRFEISVAEIPFPLASGTISFFYNNADAQQCGTVPIVVGTNDITAPVATQFPPIAVRITTFTFLDVCGNTHKYDAAGAPACNDIRGTGTGFGNITLACNTRLDNNCPELCE